MIKQDRLIILLMFVLVFLLTTIEMGRIVEIWVGVLFWLASAMFLKSGNDKTVDDIDTTWELYIVNSDDDGDRR